MNQGAPGSQAVLFFNPATHSGTRVCAASTSLNFIHVIPFCTKFEPKQMLLVLDWQTVSMGQVVLLNWTRGKYDITIPFLDSMATLGPIYLSTFAGSTHKFL